MKTLIYSAEDYKGETQYLMQDSHSGGYPCWISSHGGTQEPVSDKTTYEIASCFRSEAGLYYSKDINPDTLKVVEFRPHVKDVINIRDRTQFEVNKSKFSHLTKEEIDFIKGNM